MKMAESCHTVFKRLVLQTLKKPGLVWEKVNITTLVRGEGRANPVATTITDPQRNWPIRGSNQLFTPPPPPPFFSPVPD